MNGVRARLKPIDIFNKDFKQAFRGYDKMEVNEFLDQVIKCYEDILQENQQLKDQMTKFINESNKKTVKQKNAPSAVDTLEVTDSELSLRGNNNLSNTNSFRNTLPNMANSGRRYRQAPGDDSMQNLTKQIEKVLSRLEYLEENFEYLRKQITK